VTNSSCRVGLIGYGVAGAVFHAPLIAATDGLTIAAIVTSDSGRREQAAREHPNARVVPNAEWLWERAGEIDVVVIASPNRTHVPLAMAALAAGLAVVVDKPLAPTVAEARRLIEEAARRRRLLTVFHNRRWDGDFLTVRQIIQERRLGDVVRLESRFDRWRETPRPGWRQLPAPEEAGGLLYDLGSHLIDQALVLFGRATHVYGELDRRRPGSAVDDDAFVALRHASGVRAHLWMTILAAQAAARFRVLGTRAGFTKFGLDVQEEALRNHADPRVPGWSEEPTDRWGVLGAGDDLQRIRTEPGAYLQFYRQLVAALEDGAPPPVNAADAVATLEIIEAAQRSSAESRVVALPHD
jgi:predicted dehydrogenase